MARLGYSEVFVRIHLAAVAAFSSSIVIAIAVGCSAPSPDGSGVNRGRGSSGSSGDDGDLDETPSSSGSSGSSGSNASCTNHEPVDDRPACDQCARANCCEQILECDNTPDCKALLKCIDENKDDIFGQLTCNTAHSKGSEVLSGVAGCAQTKCEAECPSQGIGDAGIDFDAF